jgi:hypothetical protein
VIPVRPDSLPTPEVLLGLPNKVIIPMEEDLGLAGLFWLPPDPEDDSDVVPSQRVPLSLAGRSVFSLAIRRQRTRIMTAFVI